MPASEARELLSLGYLHQGREFSDDSVELRKHLQVAPGSPHLLGAGRVKHSAGQP